MLYALKLLPIDFLKSESVRKKKSDRNFSFFLVEKRFQKKVTKKSTFGSKIKISFAKLMDFVDKNLIFSKNHAFFAKIDNQLFFLKWFFDQKKWKFFDRIFFLRTDSDFRKSIGSSFRAYNTRHQIQKKVAEKVRGIPNPKLTGVSWPRDISIVQRGTWIANVLCRTQTNIPPLRPRHEGMGVRSKGGRGHRIAKPEARVFGRVPFQFLNSQA